ncbi:MAG: Type IV pilus assembly protein PilM [Parcubacteria group bacterium GW2011_GWA2_39_18]|nr:MAG: Type IV pilus assembly protein PilM [Parcubacteria group bacterium GW2011_GWA2_39_18]
MVWSLFGKYNYLGIDFGESSIKIVELEDNRGTPFLKNYAVASLVNVPENLNGTPSHKPFFSENQHAKTLESILSKLNIKSKKAFFSLPIYPSFSTTIEIPLMSKKEMDQAVPLEARKYVPIPLNEVVLDWNFLGKTQGDSVERMRIFIVAVPNNIVQKYINIARQNRLKVEAMELETFSSARAILDFGEERPVMVVDIGANSTDVAISYKGQVEMSHNFEISGFNFTYAIAKSLNVDINRAEQLKRNVGLLGSGGEQELSSILFPLLDAIIEEVRRTAANYEQKYNRPIKKVMLTGGSANLKGLINYFVKQLNIEIGMANPFLSIKYPPQLEKTLRELGPELSVACGLALKGLSNKNQKQV